MQRTQYRNTTTAFTQEVLVPLTNLQGMLIFQLVHHLNKSKFLSLQTTASRTQQERLLLPILPLYQLGKTSGFAHEAQCMLEYYGHSSLSVSSVSVPGIPGAQFSWLLK